MYSCSSSTCRTPPLRGWRGDHCHGASESYEAVGGVKDFCPHTCRQQTLQQLIRQSSRKCPMNHFNRGQDKSRAEDLKTGEFLSFDEFTQIHAIRQSEKKLF